MKIFVPAKWVVDYTVKVRVKRNGSGAGIANIKMSISGLPSVFT